jgi:hypothetical protein
MAKRKNTPNRKKLTEAEKFARRVARRCDLLAPRLPHIDRHDMELIVAELLKTREERMRVMFLHRHDKDFISFNKTLLAKLAEALAQAELEAFMLDDTTAIASGAAAPKKKIDLLVRNDKDLQAKLKKFERAFGVARLRPVGALSKVVRAVGPLVSVDFLFAHSSKRRFNSLKARAERISCGPHELSVAARGDIAAATGATYEL